MKVLVVFDDSERIDHTDSKSQQDIVFTERDVERVLNEQGHTVQALAVRENLWEALTPYNPREWLIFNLCEQIRAKTYLEPYATSIYEHLGFSYTGSNRHTLAACLNKPRTKEILQAHDIPTAAFQVLSPNALTRRLDFPLFVKPIAEDASIGITPQSVVTDDEMLRRQVNLIWKRYRQPALVEEFIAGREINVTLLGNDQPIVFPLSEIEFKQMPNPLERIVSFRAKWDSASPEFRLTVPRCPPRVSDAVKARIEHVALRAYQTMGLRDYGRVDLRVRNGQPYVLEVNPNADLSHDAGIARAARVAGLSYAELIDEIVRLAGRRHNLKGVKRPRVISYGIKMQRAQGSAIHSIPLDAFASLTKRPAPRLASVTA